jgi:hypothetical protein
MQQLSVKSALREWGDDARAEGEKEVNLDYTIAWLRDEYESVFANGSGMMKVAQGKVHKYLGMTLDFTTSKIMKVTMLKYVDEIIGSWDKACSELNDRYKAVSGCKRIATAAPDNLFKVDDDAVKLDHARAKAFHNITAKGIYVTKRARPDISLSIAFLTARVKGPDIDDWRKLCHLVEYLCSTCELPLILTANGTGVLSWYVDTLFAVHPDMRWHTGGRMTMGTGFPLDKLAKHKLNTCSSTKSDIVAVNDLIPQILWAHFFMKAQGFAVSNNILNQDNKSAMLLETNGQASSSKRTRHIKIWYYHVANQLAKGRFESCLVSYGQDDC